jgi:hypothetical protein
VDKIPKGCPVAEVVSAIIVGALVDVVFGLDPAPPMLPVFNFSFVAVFSSSWLIIDPAELYN